MDRDQHCQGRFTGIHRPGVHLCIPLPPRSQASPLAFVPAHSPLFLSSRHLPSLAIQNRSKTLLLKDTSTRCTLPDNLHVLPQTLNTDT